MPSVFVDTSGWANIVDRDEAFHERASSVYQNLVATGARLVTTNYVLTELVAIMERPLRIPRSKAIEFIEGIVHSPHVDVVHISPGIHASAWALLVARPDKLWSLVDCSSFVVMEQGCISEALTTDRHFEQAGFVRLLR